MTGKMRPDDGTHGREVLPGAEQSPAANADDARLDRSLEPGEPATSHGDPEALNRLEAENAALKDRLLRALAEIENVRRRAERDQNDVRQYAVAKFAGDMLSVADNLERAIGSIPQRAREGEGAVKTLIEGVELTEKEMLRALEKHGIRKLDPIGKRFDPHFHEAMFEMRDPSVPSGTVTRVVQPGYSIGSRALRPAKVGISSGGPQRTTPGPAGESDD